MADDQDRAEVLDDDKVGGEFPPDRPLGAHRHQDDVIPESFAGRDERTEPEVGETPSPEGVTVPMQDDDRVTADDEVAETPEAAEEAALHVEQAP